MRFSLTNIGKIAQADIEINGLTVLGGYNDIGKSTIGKTIFSVIKTISDIEQETLEAITEQIEQELIEFSVEIRKITGERFSISLKSQENIEKYISVLLLKIREELHALSFSTTEATKINNLLNSLEERIKKICHPEKNESYKKVFDSINYSLFRGDIQNNHAVTTESSIVSTDEACELEISLEHGRTISFLIKGDFLFQNVTLVDSPLVVGWVSAVGVSRTHIKETFGHYVFDLLNKIRFSTEESYDLIPDSQRKLVEKIRRIIGGLMFYDRAQRNFVFKQENMVVQPINLASGIKIFGIIQMLLAGEMIIPNTVLMIDEPEAHLHPEWQLKYAEVLTQLVDMGVYVLVSTHSPYMIEALKHYSDKLQQEKITNFYLGSAGEHGTVFSDVTQNLDALFELLAKPMQRLAFES